MAKPEFGNESELVKCSFCGKSQRQVKKLIAGPGVNICDECVELCDDILDEEVRPPEVRENGAEPNPELVVWTFVVQAQTDDPAAKDRLLQELRSWPGRVTVHLEEQDASGRTIKTSQSTLAFAAAERAVIGTDEQGSEPPEGGGGPESAS